MLEYFIATPGARKGLVDTALRTADSGYLTRRLVDVAQELIIREPDCQRDGDPVRGLWIEDVVPDTAGERTYLETRLFGRTLADDVKLSDGTVLEAGNQIGDEDLDALRDDPEVDRVRVRSVLTCQSRPRRLRRLLRPLAGHRQGHRARRGGRRHRRPVHRRARHAAHHADLPHRRHRRHRHRRRSAPRGRALRGPQPEGQGHPGPHLRRRPHRRGRGQGPGHHHRRRRRHRGRLHRARAWPASRSPTARRSPPATRSSTVPATPRSCSRSRASARPSSTSSSEVQKVYRDQGVSIHDKHIELIVRQMTRRVGVQEPGDSPLPARASASTRRSTPTPTARSSRRARCPPRAGPS